MAYTPTYTDEDLSPVVIDFLVTAGATLVSFAVIVALVALVRWLMGKPILG